MERAAHAILADSGRTVGRLAAHSARAVAAAAESAVASLGQGGSIYFCGNGGSAADAQHLACELAGRYLLDRPPLPAVALSTNSSSLTAIGNDFGYDQVFARQLEGLGSPGDVLVAITTSGRSPNIRRAVETARRLGMTVIGFTGLEGVEFAAACDVALVSPHRATPRIQEGHLAMGHALCELVERALFPAPAASEKSRRAARATGARSRRGSRSARSSAGGRSRRGR
jgi:D-sedoheptulose 7-phosphate isomerase